MGLFFYTKKGSIISTVDLPTTEIIEPKKGSIISTVDLPTTEIIEPFSLSNPLISFLHYAFKGQKQLTGDRQLSRRLYEKDMPAV